MKKKRKSRHSLSPPSNCEQEHLIKVQNADISNDDCMNRLSLEIICHIMEYLSFFDIMKLDGLSKKLREAVTLHLRIRKTINFTENKTYGWMSSKITDSILKNLLGRCHDLQYIYNFHPPSIYKRRTRGSDSLSIPGMVEALAQCVQLKGIELSNIFLLEAMLTYLPLVEILGTFKNRSGTFPVDYNNLLVLPENSKITSLHLIGVVLEDLPPMRHLKHLQLRWVHLANCHPFKDFSAPQLQSFVMAHCAGPANTNSLKYVPLITALSAARNLKRLELIRVPFLGGLIQHVVEDSWRTEGFRQLNNLRIAACKHALEMDVGFLAITANAKLEELSMQPSLTKDSLFVALKLTDVSFPYLQSLQLGYVDSFPEQGQWTNEELIMEHLSDVVEFPSTITDIGIKYVGQCFPDLRNLEIFNCPYLHKPSAWITAVDNTWSNLKELYLRKCHAIRLEDFCLFIKQLPSLELLHLEQMFKEPPKGCSRVGLSAGTGFGMSSALVAHQSHHPGGQNVANEDDEQMDSDNENNNNEQEIANQVNDNNNVNEAANQVNDNNNTNETANQVTDNNNAMEATNQEIDKNNINEVANQTTDNDINQSANHVIDNSNINEAANQIANNNNDSRLGNQNNLDTEKNAESTDKNAQDDNSFLAYRVEDINEVYNDDSCLEEGMNDDFMFSDSEGDVYSAESDTGEKDELEKSTKPMKSDKMGEISAELESENSYEMSEIVRKEVKEIENKTEKSTDDNSDRSQNTSGTSRNVCEIQVSKYQSIDTLSKNTDAAGENSNCEVSSREEESLRSVDEILVKESTTATNQGNFENVASCTETLKPILSEPTGDSCSEMDVTDSENVDRTTVSESISCKDNKDGNIPVSTEITENVLHGKRSCVKSENMETDQEMSHENKCEKQELDSNKCREKHKHCNLDCAINKESVCSSGDGSQARVDDSQALNTNKRHSESIVQCSSADKTDTGCVSNTVGNSSSGGAGISSEHGELAVQSKNCVSQLSVNCSTEGTKKQQTDLEMDNRDLHKDVLPRENVSNVKESSGDEMLVTSDFKMENSGKEETTPKNSLLDVDQSSTVEEMEIDTPLSSEMDQDKKCLTYEKEHKMQESQKQIYGKTEDNKACSSSKCGTAVEMTDIEIPNQEIKELSNKLETDVNNETQLQSCEKTDNEMENRELMHKSVASHSNCSAGEKINNTSCKKNSEEKLLECEQGDNIKKDNSSHDKLNDNSCDKTDNIIDLGSSSSSDSKEGKQNSQNADTTNHASCSDEDDTDGEMETMYVIQIKDNPRDVIFTEKRVKKRQHQEQPKTWDVSGEIVLMNPSGEVIAGPKEGRLIGKMSDIVYCLDKDENCDTDATGNSSDEETDKKDVERDICQKMSQTMRGSDIKISFLGEENEQSIPRAKIVRKMNAERNWKIISVTVEEEESPSGSAGSIDCGQDDSKTSTLQHSDGQTSRGKSLCGKKKGLVKKQNVTERETTDMSPSKVNQGCQTEPGSSTTNNNDEAAGPSGENGASNSNNNSISNMANFCAVASGNSEPEMCDQATSTGDPVIEEDHVQVLEVTSESLTCVTLHLVGITNLVFKDCPKLNSVTGNGCRVLKEVKMTSVPRIQRLTFTQCKKMNSENLLKEISYQVAQKNRLVFLRPLQEFSAADLEKSLFCRSDIDYNICFIYDYSEKPQNTLYNRKRVSTWTTLFSGINGELLTCYNFPAWQGSKSTVYPWGRNIYKMTGENEDGSGWEIVTDIPWLKPLSECTDLSTKSLKEEDSKCGLYCPAAKGHFGISECLLDLQDEIALQQSNGLSLFAFSVVVYINMCDVLGVPTPDPYI